LPERIVRSIPGSEDSSWLLAVKIRVYGSITDRNGRTICFVIKLNGSLTLRVSETGFLNFFPVSSLTGFTESGVSLLKIKIAATFHVGTACHIRQRNYQEKYY